MAIELSDVCKKCQLRHVKEVKKEWKVKCNGIPKELWETGLYPIHELIGMQEYAKLEQEQKIELQMKYNKLFWAETKLGWSPYMPKRNEYQEWQKATLLCTAKSKACRFGRRMGKTETICIDAIHYCDTTSIKNANVMIVVPYQNLLEEIFDRLKNMLSSENSSFRDRFTSKKSPFQISFDNGTKILGFTTGAASGSEGASTRGQRCDKLFLDECDYLRNGDIETVMALKMEHPDFEVTVTSTPSSTPGKFREYCLYAGDFKDFHFPSTLMSSFIAQEEELRADYSKEGFAREVLAEFYESSSKVFETDDLREALKEYNYYEKLEDVPDYKDYVTTIGCDWNSFKNGTQIVVLGYNHKKNDLKVLRRESIKKGSGDDGSVYSKFLQEESIGRIIKNFYAFKSKAVYVDKGYGGFQTETLEKYFYESGNVDIFKAIDFGSAYKDKHPITGETRSRNLKGIMVYSLQRQIEKRRLSFSIFEEGKIEQNKGEWKEKLTYQLNNYIVDHFTSNDNPVFAHDGDHTVDALMLANFAFMEKIEGSLDFSFKFDGIGGIVDKKQEQSFKEQPKRTVSFIDQMEDAKDDFVFLDQKKEDKKSSVIGLVQSPISTVIKKKNKRNRRGF